jgi:transcription elongation factor Elf1
MAFKIICDFCESESKIEFEKGFAFIVCENCGQEREIMDGSLYMRTGEK